ncbi:MaoC family dehydratase N-terminal domain-containing protein [Helcobacillus massiliensis]|uniref:FAS1-like dehydratase domain-containing protein n=1 Tax=Helcobacillus TaxID=1161125 RepID=UPI001EF72AC1|nr:MaoC family dehydratase N-terminal domain-containing protein [Helcobacillus massiliensis]MCG7427468.1 MaoC family dehydratase N-terminal domain-containing protein [Helcobacillus sp. ACRRO]MCT1557528.1 MaoC family dehydratase N-terminal domain-containing protein [Helcobacillus massiliensis]MCT2037405.1 MaoC family dehydratase N-terminal domain-containing protein [Helcobacillus massiliensis]MCT2331967.1 MaoC family dehydratase N-terminal domain-containing protein [Helcobacillus massiliensis]
MTQPNPDYAGRQYPPGDAAAVTADAIRAFATATGAANELHHSTDAARAAGYRDIVATPTFLVSLAQQAEAAYINDPDAGVDFSRVVHSDESFDLARPIVAGDVLTPQLTVESVKSVGPHAMISTRVDFTDADGAHAASVRSSLVVRGEEN